jgi:hypothetical protein
MRKKILHSEQVPEKTQQIKGGPFKLGRIGTLNQGLTALSKVIRASADGTIDSQLGARLANMLGIHRQYLETMTLERLEAKLDGLTDTMEQKRYGHQEPSRPAIRPH